MFFCAIDNRDFVICHVNFLTLRLFVVSAGMTVCLVIGNLGF
jgi:hypothetical protein